MPQLNSLYGLLDVPDWESDLIIKSLQMYGEWGAAEVDLLAPLVTSGETVWDIGAFLGTFSLGLARLVAPGKVLAIEANASLRDSLEANLLRNLPCPATVLNIGIGETDGWIAPRTQEEADNHGARAYARAPVETEQTIVSKSLRSLRAVEGDYDVLKIDIEGMEHEAMRGDYAYLKARQPIIWAECNEDPGSLQLLGLFKSLGYDPVYLAFPAFPMANFRNASNLSLPMAYEAALLAAPPDRLERLTGTIAGEDIICRPVNTGFELRKALYDTPRWCTPDWASMNRAELIARLGRQKLGMTLGNFLTGDS